MARYEVTEVKRLNTRTALLSLRAHSVHDKLRFYPGQYAAISFRTNGRPTPMRCFSIVSSANFPGQLQFAFRIQGEFTKNAAQLERGARVDVRGPFGNFTFDAEVDRRIMLLAGGIGITPYMSMLRFAAETQLDIPITLLYSCSSVDDVPFYEEILELERRNPRFRAAFFITRKGDTSRLQGARVVHGRITGDLLDQATAGRTGEYTFFICGSQPFNDGMVEILAERRVRADRVITEAFTQGSTMKTEGRHSIQAVTFAATAAVLAIGIFGIMAMDLVRATPKLTIAAAKANAAQAVSQASTSTNSSQVTNPGTSSPATDGTSSGSSSTSTDSSPTSTVPSPTTSNNASGTTNANNYAPSYSQYVSPVTSVS